ncbi:MAG TPA: aldo/keto reductase, partial [Pseudogracilibacillus sp.]|nr:aldo/keto reductase [Pseudogracilibacillus sp.]
RWHLERDTIIIPKSVTPSRIKENFDVFDFELTKDDMEEIASYESNGRTGANSSEPDFMKHFEGM